MRGSILAAFLVAGTAFGQIIGFPGGGIPFPGRGRNSTSTQPDNKSAAEVSTLSGTLRNINKKELVLQTDDKRVITVALDGHTRYLKASGNAKSSDFQPGDLINIDATQDNSNYYHAKEVTQVRVGTPEERAAASKPVDASPIGDNGSNDSRTADSQTAETKVGGSVQGDDDRPILRRNNSSNDTNTEIRPQITDGDSNDSQPASRHASRASNSNPPPAPQDPEAPVLRRGAPAKSSSSDDNASPETTVAQNNPPSRPSIQATDSNGVTRLPDAPKISTSDDAEAASINGTRRGSVQRSGDSVIDDARDAAFSFSQTLPNYVVKQFVTRYQTEAARGGQTSWQALDTVTVDVTSENGRESYKNILVNGRAPKEAVEKTGTWSTGEYSSVLLDVLSPSTAAHFFNKRTTNIASRTAYRYDFSVEQPNSHWHVYSSSQSYLPAYSGSLWIDKDTSRVLRIEMSAKSMPSSFPLDTVESAVDYDFVLIGESKFLLPVHSEALSCERGTSICSRNVIDFRNYKKFSADSSITFDDNK